jgi:transcriptional regulator with XRE-family HTH domain
VLPIGSVAGRRALARQTREYIGRRVVELRQARGWERSDLLQATGLTWHALDKLERGVSAPSIKVLLDLMRVLETNSFDEFLGGPSILHQLEATAAASTKAETPS